MKTQGTTTTPQPAPLGITPGEWKVINATFGTSGSQPVISTANETAKIAELPALTNAGGKVNIRAEEIAANARLIAEAGTVTNETGKTPRQLLAQRDELLAALRGITDCFLPDSHEPTDDKRRDWVSAAPEVATKVRAARTAIQNATR